MAGDNQQFCLRWNNHQSTLISVFDSLLESGTLVDCTLAAEGQYLKAHKVVLSACSPYLEVLLSQHYEKHPIVILKDVKFQELKSMMDYMYRGEVNITQDQLATFLKAAESLQIKGLSESSGGDDARDVGSTTKRQREDPPPRRPVNPHPQARLPHSSGLTIEPRRSIPHSSEMAPASPMKSREGSTSPVARKRRRRRPSTGDDASNAALSDSQLETSNSCDLPPISNQAQSTPISVPSILATPSASNNQPIESDQPLETDALNRFPNTPGGELMVKTKMEPNTDQLIEPKTEYLEDVNNEDSVEDLTLDDDDEMPGPSHADGSNQSFAQWQMSGDRSTDEVFMAAQEAVGAHRDSQEVDAISLQVGLEETGVGVSKKAKMNDLSFLKIVAPSEVTDLLEFDTYIDEATGVETPSNLFRSRSHQITPGSDQDHARPFTCELCFKSYKRKVHLQRHEKFECKNVLEKPNFLCLYCSYNTSRADNLKSHMLLQHHLKDQ